MPAGIKEQLLSVCLVGFFPAASPTPTPAAPTKNTRRGVCNFILFSLKFRNLTMVCLFNSENHVLS